MTCELCEIFGLARGRPSVRRLRLLPSLGSRMISSFMSTGYLWQSGREHGRTYKHGYSRTPSVHQELLNSTRFRGVIGYAGPVSYVAGLLSGKSAPGTW